LIAISKRLEMRDRFRIALRPVLLPVALFLLNTLANRLGAASVVINEIHFDPADKRPLEFVELHNPTAAEIRGEKLTLRDDARRIVDEVHYGAGFPWPTAARGAGSSLERIHPRLPSADPASWRSAGYPAVSAASSGTVFLPAEDSAWHWRKGTNEASQPVEEWRRLEFAEDGTWQPGQTSIGYGDDDDRTVLTDMQGHYSSLFLRHSFVVSGKVPPAVLLRVRVDDGCIAWINSREVARFHIRGGRDSIQWAGRKP